MDLLIAFCSVVMIAMLALTALAAWRVHRVLGRLKGIEPHRVKALLQVPEKCFRCEGSHPEYCTFMCRRCAEYLCEEYSEIFSDLGRAAEAVFVDSE